MAQELSQRLGATTLARETNSNYEIPDSKDSNWVWSNFDPSNWNKSFPYQLIIVDASKGYARMDGYQPFTLPIPPQELTISMPSAINVSATLGGVVEEHNGAPFRLISASGTTGVVPLRGRADVSSRNGSLRSIFGGTLAAGSKLVTDTKTLFAKTGLPTLNLINDPAGNEVLQSTGYYQFMVLYRFLENYLNLKKAGNKNMRLAFSVWKDAASYLVTPLDFTVRRSVNSPLEYSYNLQFKAFKRIEIDGAPVEQEAFVPITSDPSLYQSILNRVQEARKVIQDSQNIITAAQTDAEGIMEAAREVTFFAKDALSAALTLQDLPSNIVNTLGEALLEAKDTFNQIKQYVDAGDLLGFQKAADAFRVYSKQLNVPETGGAHQAKPLAANEITEILNNPTKHRAFFGAIDIGRLKLRQNTASLVSTERSRIRTLTRLDFEKRRDATVQNLADFADNVGAGSAVYNDTYGRKTLGTTRAPTGLDYDIIFAMNEIVMCMNYLVASSRINHNVVTPVEYVAGLAAKSGIAFRVPKSKFAVPFPYGSSLQQLANTYLNNPNRWMEIATLNGLQQPYVDEVGFALPLLLQGVNSDIQVADASLLYIGQAVWVSSNTVSATKRHITNIRAVSTNNYIVTLDGQANLNALSPNDSAIIRAFLPNTVNSQMMIYIPSDQDLQGEDLQTKSIPGINVYDNLIITGGVDVLLTPDGDWAITPDGDVRLAVGLTNMVQKVRIALGTPQGSLLLHPTFGLAIDVGSSTADMTSQQLLAAAKDMFKNDSSFTGVRSASVVKQGPTVFLSIAVGIAGASDLIPVTVAVKQ